jgi:hypothetical protein
MLGIILLVVGAVLWILGAMGARLAAVGATGSPLGAQPTDPTTMPYDFPSMSGHVQAAYPPWALIASHGYSLCDVEGWRLSSWQRSDLYPA